MVGILLLLISIYLYIANYKRWSILIYIGMLNKGYQVLNDSVIGIKNLDIAFIYMVVICIYSQIYEKPPKDEFGIRKHVYWLFAFMVCSVLFSYIHYEFTFAQILQGSRHLWFFMSFIFLRKLRYKDFTWIFEKLYYITIITAVLYIIQVLFNLPVLPYEREINIDNTLGIGRYYNMPSFLYVFLISSIVTPILIKRYKFSRICSIVLFIALICTQGRTYIGINIAIIALGIIMTRKLSNYLRYALLLIVVLMPFSDMLFYRFEGRKGRGTSDDLENIINGEFIKAVEKGQGAHNLGTMTYRFAWVYERAKYLSHRPLGENIFGLGLISDSQSDATHKIYHFNVGLRDQNGSVIQMWTPDIAYGNLIAQYGYLGGILLLFLWIKMLLIFYKHRKINPLYILSFLSILLIIFNSFSSVGVSGTYLLVFYFCVIATLQHLSLKKIDLIKK